MKFARRLPLSCLAAGLLAAVASRGAEPAARATLADAWQTLSIGFYSDAIDQFTAAGSSREAQLGLAIAQLNRPPVTPSSLAEAQRQFTELAGSDAIGHAARYFLGRLQQMHPMTPDPVAAAREYEQLVATGADDTWCRLALVKLAILRLTVLPAAGGLAAQLAAVEPLLARTADPATQHDLHLVIAEARLNHEIYDATTLGHLRAALATTRESDTMRSDMLVQIARLATLLGDRATAQEHYERFLHDYPKDRRYFTVNEALAHLGGPFPP
jgi:tetratricopeptide (TPR) repeat protein